MGVLTVQGWQSLSQWTVVIAAIAGGISVVASLLSTVAANRASDLVQADADRRIAEAHSKASVADAKAADASLRVAASELEAARLKESAANLEKEAEQAKLEQERLKATLAWRELSPAQSDTLVENLLDTDLTLDLVDQMSNPEAEYFADQFDTAFRRAGLRVDRSTAIMMVLNGPTTSGVVVSGRHAETSVLSRALAAANIAHKTQQEDTSLRLLISFKPRTP